MGCLIEGNGSCVATWLEAVRQVEAAPRHEANNILIEIEQPYTHSARELEVITKLDEFLVAHGGYPVTTVANTIFPKGLYNQFGAPAFYDVYLDRVYPRITKAPQWGRYFGRMIHRTASGGTVFNPLQILIEQMKNHVYGTGPSFRNVYEMAISDPTLDLVVFDPERDQRRTRGRQCMSFISFKLTAEKRVSLTAVYRNHYYIQRLLGNMIGLSNLLAFVAEQAELEPATFSILSTHAEVEAGGDAGWRRGDLRELLNGCREILVGDNELEVDV